MCQWKYCNLHQITKGINQEETLPGTRSYRPELRSSEKEFSFEIDCFFCGKVAKFERKMKYNVLQIKSIRLKDNILKMCHKRADIGLIL